MKSADLIQELKTAGWALDRVRGSHHVFKHPTKPGIIVVPHPKKDLGVGLEARHQSRGAFVADLTMRPPPDAG